MWPRGSARASSRNRAVGSFAYARISRGSAVPIAVQGGGPAQDLPPQSLMITFQKDSVTSPARTIRTSGVDLVQGLRSKERNHTEGGAFEPERSSSIENNNADAYPTRSEMWFRGVTAGAREVGIICYL